MECNRLIARTLLATVKLLGPPFKIVNRWAFDDRRTGIAAAEVAACRTSRGRLTPPVIAFARTLTTHAKSAMVVVKRFIAE